MKGCRSANMPHRHPALFYFKPFKLCDMNFSRISRSSKTALITLGICSLLLGCEDSPFYDRSGSDSPYPVFNVSVMSGWTAGTRVTRNGDTEVQIDEINSIGEEKLYLISEITEINDSLMSGVSGSSTRGERVTTTDKLKEKFGTDFGLYAVCYSGSSEKTDWTNAGDVTPNVANNLKMSWSTETVSASDKTLLWTGEGRMRFMAYAPYDENGEHYGIKSKWEDSSKGLEFTVNDKIKEQVDLLIAYEDCPGDNRQNVNLSFGHALSAVSFKTGEMLAGKITEIKVSGIYGSGTLNLLTNTWTATGNKKPFIMSSGTDQELGENGIELGSKDNDNPYTEGGNLIAGGEITDSKGNTIDDCLTLFMIPQELTDEAKVTVTFKDDISGGASERTLTYSIGGSYTHEGATVNKKWEAGKLYSYSLSTNGIVITPVVELKNKKTGKDLDATDSVSYAGVIKDVSFNAYVKIDQQEHETVYKNVPFAVESTVKGENNWTQGAWEPDPTTGVYAKSESAVSEGDKPVSQTGRLVLKPQDEFANTMRKDLNKAESIGTVEEPIDLSGGGETANCYMIHKPGYYKIPLYYGNKSATTALPADRDPGINYFVDHNNKQIFDNKISEQLKRHGLSLKDAFLIWQDSPGLVDNVKLIDNDWIVFRVSPNTISQGNSLIALRDNKNDIAWSWHIWVTHHDWTKLHTTKTSYPTNAQETFEFPETVLGYCEAHDKAEKRNLNVRFIFDLKDIDGNKLVYNLENSEGNLMDMPQCEILKSMAGDATYFQWGRKDPFPGGIYDQAGDPEYTGHTYYNPKTIFDANEFTMLNKPIFDEQDDDKKDAMDHTFKFMRPADRKNGINIGEGIKHPNWFPRGEGGTDQINRRHWHTLDIKDLPYANQEASTPSFYNAWNLDATKCGNSSAIDQTHGLKVKKTIYDPSPAGFCVPPALAFSGFVDAKKDYGVHPHITNQIKWDGSSRSWTFNCNKDGSGDDMKLYALGLRDMSPKEENINNMHPALKPESTWASYSMVTFIASSTMRDNKSSNKKDHNQVEIMYIDNRKGVSSNNLQCGTCASSQNSYGMSVWPVKIKP